MQETDVAIVGAGPAGLAAAREASQAGAKVVLIDQYLRPGGQYFRQLPPGFTGNSRPDWGEDEEKGSLLLQGTTSERIELLTDTVAFSIYGDKTLALARQNHFFQLRAQKLILATGAYERPVPFPGWTLPGVLSAGAMQTLVKIQRVLPGRRIVVAGAGPLLYVVAAMLVDAGADVGAVVDAARLRRGWRQIPRLWRHWQPLLQGMEYLKQLRDAGVPVLTGHTILRAEGEEKVQRAVIVEVDNEWRPVPGTERSYDLDALCVSFGFLPSTELARLAGCNVVYRPDLGGFVPEHNQEMETSLAGVFVAGEVAGIGGAGIAMVQGRIAGIVAARQLGHINADAAEEQLASARKELAGLETFREAMNEMVGLRPAVWELMQDDTIVCRCQEVTKAELRDAARASTLSAREVKLRTWAGMGPCQGRFCGDVILRIMAEEKGVAIDQIPAPRVRPPVHTVPLAALAQELEESDEGE
ncbi:MAG: NAD(P)/FAD-dependent oxidoreductase [Ardenticatenaceae bacterium]|nr:NAD(P)/FAD-dependent oxidoreductase [Ardenticatenaceae bacterium]